MRKSRPRKSEQQCTCENCANEIDELAFHKLNYLLGSIKYVRYSVKGILDDSAAEESVHEDTAYCLALMTGMVIRDFGTATLEERIARTEKVAYREISSLSAEVFERAKILSKDAELHIEATWDSFIHVVENYPNFRPLGHISGMN